MLSSQTLCAASIPLFPPSDYTPPEDLGPVLVAIVQYGLENTPWEIVSLAQRPSLGSPLRIFIATYRIRQVLPSSVLKDVVAHIPKMDLCDLYAHYPEMDLEPPFPASLYAKILNYTQRVRNAINDHPLDWWKEASEVLYTCSSTYPSGRVGFAMSDLRDMFDYLREKRFKDRPLAINSLDEHGVGDLFTSALGGPILCGHCRTTGCGDMIRHVLQIVKGEVETLARGVSLGIPEPGTDQDTDV
ncbi:hypothetical protein PM082_023938 [Marasmius tenuissimus]|nr:hypothetical protein PM082_023938 [Marasmius tenuissimus]